MREADVFQKLNPSVLFKYRVKTLQHYNKMRKNKKKDVNIFTELFNNPYGNRIVEEEKRANVRKRESEENVDFS